jgi:predicted phosphoadenosine phosphosulfate sulfurtransferase
MIISIGFSGGKDSTVLFHLINEEAKKRDRKFILYFQDQEAEYQGTVDFVEWAMSQPNVIPLWYQVPIFMTNAASHQQLFLWAWEKMRNG